MLYATTRNRNDVHTAYRAIHLDCAEDGGLFLPFSMPKLEQGQLRELKERSFVENVAGILNLFFSAGLTGEAVSAAIGKDCVQNVAIHNRLVICEGWHNSHWRFAHLEQKLSDLVRKEGIGEEPSNWMRVAIRIAVLFAVYGQLLSGDILQEQSIWDVAVTAGDFAMPIACWYARCMGLPIGTVICGCNSNGAVWELLHRGQLNPSAPQVRTCTPAADEVLPRDLERLIGGTCDDSEMGKFLESIGHGSTYTVNELQFEKLQEGVFASVNSDSRVISVISNFFTTNHYVLSPYAALAYGSLSDYRAKTGESRMALLISECSPVRDDAFVASAMNISVPELEKLLNLA